MPVSSNMIRLSVSEAAKLFGVSTRTIRRAITEKEVNYIVVQGRYKVSFESLLKWSQRTTTVRNKLAKHGIGQFVEDWKIRNVLYSPNPDLVSPGQSDNTDG
ncbi:MAG: hypothetical protein UY72_C0017G0008 [Candidatus Uhrbacteria bacterium GW2011_GWD2_52_7]|uniref:Helix-turn-helix domain-containing protein n=1 Tax=Candidatus Uhrbacteria bacterium GW2011_GWD2_52_7 TaxID=1618989 RepID=A0A0G1XH69_9BACT|nr:MAG: hypothetical protein UY72_C0017G0008 [Candidatus Uhrbacteria bacterium GW2011_GWD2_52_7]